MQGWNRNHTFMTMWMIGALFAFWAAITVNFIFAPFFFVATYNIGRYFARVMKGLP